MRPIRSSRTLRREIRHGLYSVALTLYYSLTQDVVGLWLFAIALAYAEPTTRNGQTTQ